MRQSKTTIKELTAMYRAVLRYGILCNAIALGFIATPASATDVSAAADLNTALQAGSEITVTDNISGVSGTTTVDGQTNTVNLNGKTISGGVDTSGYLFNGGSLTLTDGGTISGFYRPDTEPASVHGSEYGVLDLRNNALLTMTGGDWTFSDNTSAVGSINTLNSSISADVDRIVFENNVSNAQSAGLRHQVSDNVYSGTSATITANEIKFNNNEIKTVDDLGTAVVGSGAAVMNSGGALNLYGDTNKFTNNKMNAEVASDRIYKVGGGAVINQSHQMANNGPAINSTMVIGKNNGSSVNTFTGNTSSTNGGAVMNRAVDDDGDATLTINGATTFDGNIATKNGGAIYNVAQNGHTATLMLNGNSNFTGNSATAQGGAIYNVATKITNNNNSTSDGIANLVLNGTSNFTNNSSGTIGGAISNSGNMSISNALFDGNATKNNGGAIYNSSISDNTSISNSIFTSNYTGTGSSTPSGSGGAIYNSSNTGKLTLKNNTFSGNGKIVDDNNNVTVKTSMGGALYNNNGAMEIVGGSITDNIAKTGGAIYVSNGSLSIDKTKLTGNTSTNGGGVIQINGGNGFAINDSTIDNNSGIKNNAHIYVADGLNLVPAGTSAVGNGGAIYNKTSGKTSTITGGSISQNIAATGGAIYNYQGIIKIDGTTFNGNVASGVSSTSAVIGGGAIRNLDTLNIKDATFTNNIAKQKGGAIFTAAGKTITFDGSNTFSGNKSDVTWDENGIITASTANDIFNNNGTINIISGAGETNIFDGGFEGLNASSSKLNINGAGTVNVANALKNHTVNVNAGELHLNNTDLTDSTIAVNSGATMNTQDGSINDYASQITLADGSRVIADANASGIDQFAIASDDTITLNGLKMLSDLDVDSVNRNLATSGNINIGDDVKVYTTANKYALTGNTSNNGVLKIEKDGVGGLKSAAGDNGNVTYTITGDDTSVDTDTTITNNDLLVKGAGTTAGDNSVKLGANLAVADDASLTIEDAKIENQDGENSTIENQQGATLTILNSKISTNINNAGVMYSDPTYYDAQVVNTGTITFDGDVFENGSSLTNSATVNLNNVEFASGSTLTGLDGNVLNVSGTSNAFNGTSSGNNVKLASSADYTGTLSNGAVDARNNTIDTVTGSVSGGDLYVDANLVSGDIDTFGNTSGATVKGIALANTGYGNSADSVSLDMGGATLDSDVDISGTNYYTSVTQSGNNVVFGDKLMNTSGTHTLLGDWNAGNYIGKSNTYNAATASYDNDGTTVGDALTALDTQAKTNADAIAGLGTSKQDVLTAGNGIDLTSNTVSVKAADTTIVVDGNGVKVGTITDANIADGSISQGKINGLTSALDAKMSAADWTVNEGANLNGAKLADGSVAASALSESVNTTLSNAATAYNAVSNATTSVASGNTNLITSAGVYTNAANAAYSNEISYADNTIGKAIKDLQNGTVSTSSLSDHTLDINANSLQVNGNSVLTTANTTNSITENSESLITSGAVYAGLSGKQDAITNDNKLSAGLIETSTDAQFVSADEKTAWNNKQNAITDGNKLSADLIETSTGAQFVSADEKTAWNNKQDAITNGNKLSAELVSGLSTVATSGKASDLTNDAGFIGTSDLVTELTSSATDDQVASAKAVYDAINDSLTGGGVVEAAVENAMAGVTTMQHTQEQMQAGVTYNNFEESTSVTEAVAALDTNMGKIHGLVSQDAQSGNKTFNGTKANASKNKDTSGNYVGNLAVGTTTEDHLVALDNAIGSLSTLDTTNGVLDNTASVATNLQNLDTALNNVRTNAVTQANLALNQSVAYTNERVSELDKELSSGIASAVALSSVAVSNVERGEVSVGAGYGYYNGRSAAAFGAAMGLSNRWSVNAGAGVSDADVSFRAGTNYKFKLF